MVIEIVRACVFGALPITLFTFLILQWSIASGRLSRFDSEESLHRQYKKQSKAARKSKGDKGTDPKGEDKPLFHERAAGDFFHNKVTFFGGGYYGTMAVLTYILIEAVEVWQFLLRFADPSNWVNNFGFDLIVEFFINSLTNLIAAFVWFNSLPDYIDINNGFIWLGASYLGYLAGLRLTAEKGDWIWGKMPGWYDRALQWLKLRTPKDN